MNHTFPKNFKVIRRDESYIPKKIQSNSSRWTILSQKISKYFVEMNSTFQKKIIVIRQDDKTFQKISK